MSVMLNNLTTGATYNVRVVAYTRVGAGPYSQPVSIFSLHTPLSTFNYIIETLYYVTLYIVLSTSNGFKIFN